MAKRKVRVNNGCPCCHCVTETREHVLKCPEQLARKMWEKQISLITNWLVKANSHPDIIEALPHTLLYWKSHQNTNHYVDHIWDEEIQSTFRHQAQLGWNSMLDGLLSIKWASLQQSYYDEIDSMKSGAKWAGTLSSRLWHAVHNMWMHRNDKLHEEEVISDFSGGRELRLACVYELELNTEGLDALYHPYLDIPIASFLAESVDFQRNWFPIVRQARENAGHSYTNIFSTSSNLRKWVGLCSLPLPSTNATTTCSNIVQ